MTIIYQETDLFVFIYTEMMSKHYCDMHMPGAQREPFKACQDIFIRLTSLALFFIVQCWLKVIFEHNANNRIYKL